MRKHLTVVSVPKTLISQFLRIFLPNSDADLVFHTIMAYQKYCYMTTQDTGRANQQFMGTVTTKFTKEAFHTLRRYMSTLIDVKDVINLQLRAQKFADAGVTMARRALDKRKDTRERLSILAVSLVASHRGDGRNRNN